MNILSFRLSDSMIQYLPSDFFKRLNFFFFNFFFLYLVCDPEFQNKMNSQLITYHFCSSKKLQKVDILQNPWDCNKCLLLWTNFLSLSVRPQLNCSEDGSEDDCLLGILHKMVF